MKVSFKSLFFACVASAIPFSYSYSHALAATSDKPVFMDGGKMKGMLVYGINTPVGKKPTFDLSKLNEEALRRCTEWGFTGIDAFDAASDGIYGGGGDGQELIVYAYQCTQ
ncbi:MAG: hypothetical protein ACPGUD_11810 [Parashewanella sp.]